MEDRLDDGDLPVTGPQGAPTAALPVEVRRMLPGLEAAAPCDLEVLRGQLGRRPQGELFVSRRCPHGRPGVIMTMPAAGDGGPVPPLFWLSCPVASSRVGTLESRGSIAAIADRLDSDRGSAAAFQRDEEDYGRILLSLARSGATPPPAGRLEGKGAAGGTIGAVKCLHAHLAYRLALSAQPDDAYDIRGRLIEGGVIGIWCEELLATEGGAWCERPPSACVT
jgi:uncharacterized protein